MAVNDCPNCLQKQRKIDALTEEVQRLRTALCRQKRKADEGYFGSSTPSSKQPIKKNVEPNKPPRKRGARPGHVGAGRKRSTDLDDGAIKDIAPAHDCCPDCGADLINKGEQTREVLEAAPVKVVRTIYRSQKRYCPHCRKTHQTSPPGVLPRSLYGNQLLANAAVMHYLHGIAMGRICEQTGVGAGALVEIFHRLSRLFAEVPDRLLEQYRKAPVKHADETGWRTNGKNGYAWLFATPEISVFKFGKSRSARVPAAVFGESPVGGVLVVDRYAAYHKLPCAIQYCYAHLLRNVQDLEKDFPDETEIKTFVATAAPLLALAMGLRSQNISDRAFYSRAKKLKAQIKAVMESPARHLAIRQIQEVFRNNEHRLYHWADDRQVPADNNLAERDLRPSVIARKVSFGSATDAGANTRSILTTVLQSLKKQGRDPTKAIKDALDEIADNPKLDPMDLLFPP